MINIIVEALIIVLEAMILARIVDPPAEAFPLKTHPNPIPTHTPPKAVNNIQPYVTAYRWLRVS